MTPIRISVVVFLAASLLWFSLAPLRGLFWLHPGSFGITADSGMQITDIDSSGPASRAGLRIGDRFDVATSFEKRLYLEHVRNPAPQQRLTLQVRQPTGQPRSVTIVADTMALDSSDIAEYFVFTVVDLVFVLVGSILVLLRPSKMTWAFFLFCIGTAPGIMLGYYWLPAWLVFASGVFVYALQALGFAAFLVFCVRVPSDRAVGGWRYIEWVAAPLVFIILLVCSIAIDLSIAGVSNANPVAERIQGAIFNATYVCGVLALVATFYRERGAERKRLAWIMAGFIILLGSKVAINLADPTANIYTTTWLPLVPTLGVAMPLTVAYAVLRHQAFHVGSIANRTLVYGLFLCTGFAAFALLDLLATKKFAKNQFEIGLDVAIALAIGLSFQFIHPRAIRLIDRIFLPERYHAAIALEKLRNTLSPIRSLDDAPNRAVEVVATELMLSSLAIFKKVPDGGFVRLASAGWPKGAAWHIFAGDPLARSFGSSQRVGLVEALAAEQLKVSREPGRPSVGMSLSPQTPGESLLLVGKHVNGRRPDRDEVRGIASLLREFITI